MSDPIQVRPVTPGDFDAWLPLWDAYNAFYGRAGETALPREIMHITWNRFYSRMPSRPFSCPMPLSFQPLNGVEMENSLYVLIQMVPASSARGGTVRALVFARPDSGGKAEYAVVRVFQQQGFVVKRHRDQH